MLIPCIILSLGISFSVTAIFRESFKHSKTLKTHLQEEPVYLWGTKQSKDQKMQIQSQSNNKQEIKTCHKLCFCYQGKQAMALVSYPGSGNTWLRHLLQLASGKHHTHLRHLQLIIFEQYKSKLLNHDFACFQRKWIKFKVSSCHFTTFAGIYTGSSYFDKELYKKGFLGEGVVNSSVVTIKTHYPYITDKEIFKPSHVILLVRKPMDAFIAEYYRALTGIHTGVVELTNSSIDKIKWNTYVHTNLTGWHLLHKFWLGRRNLKFYIMQYEKLRRNVRSELKKVLSFLQVKLSDGTMRCVLKNAEGNFRRKTLQKHKRELLFGLLDDKTKNRVKLIYENILEIAQKKINRTF